MGQSQFACGPRHMVSPSGATVPAAGCVLFSPFRIPATRPEIGASRSEARATSTATLQLGAWLRSSSDLSVMVMLIDGKGSCHKEVGC